MNQPAYTIGQAVFLRTDTPDYEEAIVVVKDLAELVRVCSQSQPNMVLEKVILYSLVKEEPCALTLGFISASKGQRPGNIPISEER